MPDFDRADLDLTELAELDRLNILRLRGIWIDSIEVTQAIQYRRAGWHLTDPADRQPDNSARLVAGKPAWVRVYLRSLLEMTGVTGSLAVSRRKHGFLWVPVATLNPEPPGTADSGFASDYATERSTLGSSLNFIIPAESMCGTLRLEATVQAGSLQASRTVTILVTLQQTLRLAGVMIAYNGPANSSPTAPNLNLAAPTVAQMQTTAAWTLTTFPVRSAGQFRSAGTVTLANPLTDAPSCAGCCSPNWVALNATVAAQKTADGNQAGWVYYGLLPNGTPMGPIIGCESSGVSTGRVGDQITMAHEIGHGCGLAHGPCGGVGASADASYPAYEPYDAAATPQGSIGEYGLDINNGNIMSPAVFKDFMTYCNPDWMSLYHHGKLINNAKLNPMTVCVDYPWWKDLVWEEVFRHPIPFPDPPDWREVPVHMTTEAPMPVITVIGLLTDNRLEVTHVARTVARPHIDGAIETSLIARLVGKEGEVLSRGSLMRLVSHAGDGCDCNHNDGQGQRGPRLLQGFLPNVDAGAALEIVDGDTVLWHRTAPEKPVAITEFKCSATRGKLRAAWSVKKYSKIAQYWLRWSQDKKSWRALATDLTRNRATLNLSHLPPGKVWIQLVAHDGFNSTDSKPVAVDVPTRGPDVAILHPSENRSYLAGQTVRLLCAATSADGSTVSPEGCLWTLDDQEPLGRGLELWIKAPSAGKHRLQLEVKDGYGATKSAISFVTVRAPG